MKTFLKIMAGLMVLGILGVAGCAALVGGAASQASRDMKASTQSANHSAHAFRVKFKQVKVGDTLTGQGGMTVKQVTALVGKPDVGDISKTETGGDSLVTYTYHFFMADGSPAWVISFTNGHVTDKSSL